MHSWEDKCEHTCCTQRQLPTANSSASFLPSCFLPCSPSRCSDLRCGTGIDVAGSTAPLFNTTTALTPHIITPDDEEPQVHGGAQGCKEGDQHGWLHHALGAEVAAEALFTPVHEEGGCLCNSMCTHATFCNGRCRDEAPAKQVICEDTNHISDWQGSS